MDRVVELDLSSHPDSATWELCEAGQAVPVCLFLTLCLSLLCGCSLSPICNLLLAR
jgi:hypothetical protein